MYYGVQPRAHLHGNRPIVPDWLVAGCTRQTLLCKLALAAVPR
jgi:hypothetical protein